MRKLKRWIGGVYAERKIAPRRAEAAKEIQSHLKLPSLPQLILSGSRGHDSNYLVSHAGKTLGVLRLINPYKKRKQPAADMPFILPDPAARIPREADIYRRGAEVGLTPRVLWQAEGALLCAYLPYLPLQERFMRTPERAWEILTRVTVRLVELHKAGITHMDASLANTLADEDMSQIFFVDFEYAPAATVPAPAQRLYDHLRLVESVWKFIPEQQQHESQAWFDAFAAAADVEMKTVDIKMLAPALGRILADEIFSARLKQVLSASK